MNQPGPDPVKRLIVALDVPDRASALKLAESLTGLAGMLKIGLELFTAEGPPLVREVVAAGHRVFLDLKFHDIPNTVARAVHSAAQLGVAMLNVHALGGAAMMQAAVQSIREAIPAPSARPTLLGVTILTSMDQGALGQVGIEHDLEEQVVRLARVAHSCQLNGVVASPREIRLIRERVADDDFIVVTPGIRPSSSESHDQKRTATPAEAISSGADYIVVGRPITGHADPASAARRVLDEVATVL